MTQSVKALRCTILVVSCTLTHTWTGAVSDINAVIFFIKSSTKTWQTAERIKWYSCYSIILFSWPENTSSTWHSNRCIQNSTLLPIQELVREPLAGDDKSLVVAAAEWMWPAFCVCRCSSSMLCVVPDISAFRAQWKSVRQPLQVLHPLSV